MAILKTDSSKVFHIICELDSAVIRETPEEQAELKSKGKLTRHEDYLENLDESKLKLKDPSEDKPTKFAIRCLRHAETTELQAKHMQFNLETRKLHIKNNAQYFLDVFNAACLGIVKEDGSIEKIDSEDLPYGVALSVGSTIQLFTTLGKNIKNG
jgi:hypothetical protein